MNQDCFTMYNNKFETQQGRTEYDTVCDIVSAKTCSVVYDKMCSMVSDRECKVEYDSIYNVCEDAQEEQCSVVNQRKCEKSHYYEELCHHTTVKSNDATKENCVDIPKEVCSRSRQNPRTVQKPVVKKWCYVPSEESGLA